MSGRPRGPGGRRGVEAVSLTLLALFLAHAYARGPDSSVRIDDHLDGIVPLYVVLASEPLIGELDDRIDQIFDGLPRNSMPSTVHLGVLLYRLFGPFWGQVVNELLMRTLALIGMALLLRRHLLPEGDERAIQGVSLCFALLPVLPHGYLSVLGQPLLLNAILDLRRGRGSVWDWLVVVLFPLYSSLIFVGLFILLLLGLLVLHDWIRTRRLNGALVAAGFVIAGLFAVAEYRLLYQSLFDDQYVSHRTEFVRTRGGILHLARAIARTFFTSQRHAASLQSPFIQLCAGAVLGWGLVAIRRRYGSLGPRALRAGPGPDSRWHALAVSLLLCGAAAVLVGLWEWRAVQELLDSTNFAPLRMYNFHRIQWFQPLLFALAFAFALHEIQRLRGVGLALLLIAVQASWSVWNSNGLTEQRYSGLSYRAYYSPELFARIRDHIGRPPESYRVVSLGLTPGIALFNGFSVLDGFVNDYPIQYKRRFRRVIASELEKDPRLRRMVDLWGGHVDVLSSELGKVSGYSRRIYTKDTPQRAVERLDLDVQALRELGGDYVLSAVEIRNHRQLGLGLEGRFRHPNSPWEIFLYSVDPEPDGA